MRKPNFTRRANKDENGLNKLEAAWLDWLRLMESENKLVSIGIQSVTLKLANDCRYTPDFWAITNDGRMVFYEVKGFMREDAAIKLKLAARLYPQFDFVLVTREGGAGGLWIQKQVQP